MWLYCLITPVVYCKNVHEVDVCVCETYLHEMHFRFISQSEHNQRQMFAKNHALHIENHTSNDWNKPKCKKVVQPIFTHTFNSKKLVRDKFIFQKEIVKMCTKMLFKTISILKYSIIMIKKHFSPNLLKKPSRI